MIRKGLTLTEVLITTCLASIVALVLYSTLSQGIRIWQSVNRDVPEEDIAIFFEKFSQDAENIFLYPAMNLTGSSATISFPTMILSAGQHPEGGRGLGVVTYAFDENEGELKRTQQTYSEFFQDKAPEGESILRRLGNFSFSYYIFDNETKEFMWADEWPPLNALVGNAVLPFGVRMSLNCTFGERSYEYSKFSYFPLSKE